MAKKNKNGDATLGGVSTSELAKEMVKRQQRVLVLKGKREKILADLHALDEQIRSEGGSLRGSSLHSFSSAEAPTQGRKRFLNKSNLVDALASSLKGRDMGVTEIAYAVVKDGYKTTAANFRTIVNQTLIRFPDRFKKVRRGVYTSKG